jgi:3-methylfumaryl-CoA hydratase
MELTADEIDGYRSYVGRKVTDVDFIDDRIVVQFSATFDVPMPDHLLPHMWHYGLFTPSTPTAKLDTDGHPRRGDFMPPVKLPRRMFAGSTLKFLAPLKIGQKVSRTAEIASVEHRLGRTGHLVFVGAASRLSQEDRLCVEELQTIVYREASATKMPPVKPASINHAATNEVATAWRPTATQLFRYSAITFNSHRIHYEERYATDVEGYPDLVVHAPLIATQLCKFAEQIAPRRILQFTFRGEAPCFVNQELKLIAQLSQNSVALHAERQDGVIAMSAEARC